MAEIAHPLNVYLIRGCEEEKLCNTEYRYLATEHERAMKRSCAIMPYAIFSPGPQFKSHPILFSHKGIVEGLFKIDVLEVNQKRALINGQQMDKSSNETSISHSDILTNEKIRLWITAHGEKEVNSFFHSRSIFSIQY